VIYYNLSYSYCRQKEGLAIKCTTDPSQITNSAKKESLYGQMLQQN